MGSGTNRSSLTGHPQSVERAKKDLGDVAGLVIGHGDVKQVLPGTGRGITHGQFSAAEETKNSGQPRGELQIQNNVKPLPPQPADNPEGRNPGFRPGRQMEIANPIQKLTALVKARVVAQGEEIKCRTGMIAADVSKHRTGQYDGADAPHFDNQDLFYGIGNGRPTAAPEQCQNTADGLPQFAVHPPRPIEGNHVRPPTA